MTQPRRVFLAHAREDKERVRAFYKEIKARGFSPWLDEEDLIGGQTWEVEVEKAICESGVFITCLSENSISKHGFVQKELRLALAEYGKRRSGSILFIPVKLDECEIPDLSIPNLGLSISGFHWIEIWKEGGIDRLIVAIERGLGPASQSMLKPGTVFPDVDATRCPESIVIPAGSFLMGSPDDQGLAWLQGVDPRRVVRGGCWYNQPSLLRSACRSKFSPDSRNAYVSFRVARTV
jgi:hypothetical protein